MDRFFEDMERQLEATPRERAQAWVRRQQGMQQAEPLTEEQKRQELRDMAPAEPDYRGTQNAAHWPIQHEHTFCSWVYGAVVFPGGHALVFPCACGAILLHASDGRSFVDYTHAVMPI